MNLNEARAAIGGLVRVATPVAGFGVRPCGLLTAVITDHTGADVLAVRFDLRRTKRLLAVFIGLASVRLTTDAFTADGPRVFLYAAGAILTAGAALLVLLDAHRVTLALKHRDAA